jgi:tRNA-dihydrouridine synthase B
MLIFLHSQNLKMNILDKIHIAPLAGISDSPFRLINRSFGAKILYSEMVSVEGLSRGHKNTKNIIKNLSEDTPFIVQLFGSKPESFKKSLDFINNNQNISEININSGCPVKKVLKSKSGGALMTDLKLLYEIVNIVKKNTVKKVSVKIRSGFDESNINALECVKVCKDAGADYVIIHPRTVKMMFSGFANWDLIKYVKENVDIKIVGNGDVVSLDQAKESISKYKCEEIMIGRAIFGNPWLLQNKQISLGEIFVETILKHLKLSLDFYGPERSYKLMKKHLIYYFKRLKENNINKKQIYDKLSKSSSLKEQENIIKQIL